PAGLLTFAFDHQKTCFAPPPRDIYDRRGPETKHPTLPTTAKKETGRVGEQRLKTPTLFIKDKGRLPWEIEGFLNNVISFQRSRKPVVPPSFSRAPSEVDSVAAIVVIWFQDECLPVPPDVVHEVDVLSAVERLSLSHSPRPGNAASDHSS